MILKTVSTLRTSVLIGWIVFSSCSIGDEILPEGVNQSDLIAELNTSTLPIADAPIHLPDKSMADFNSLANAGIIGLGEATHGTHEFFEMKHRIIKYLVEYHGFRAIAFESDFGEALAFDRHITTGEGNLDRLMKSNMYYFFWSTDEVKALLEWMRSYNRGRKSEEMIHYLGFDCQLMDVNTAELLSILKRISPSIHEYALGILEPIGRLDHTAYVNMTEEHRDVIEENLTVLYSDYQQREPEFQNGPNHLSYRIALRLLRVLIQTNMVNYCDSHNMSDSNPRDEFMAENALWISRFYEGGGKTALWAHNSHIAEVAMWGGAPMGAYLRDALGDLYRTVGFSFSTGNFNALGESSPGVYTVFGPNTIDSIPEENSVTYLFHQGEYDNFIFPIYTLPENSHWKTWLTSAKPCLLIGSVYNGDPTHYYADLTSHTFDILIHFDSTKATRLLE